MMAVANRAWLTVASLAAPIWAFAQAPASIGTEERQSIEKQLIELREMRRDMVRRMQDWDERIAALETELQAALPESAAQRSPGAPVSTIGEPPTEGNVAQKDRWGAFEPGRGFVLARTELGEVDFSVFSYVRYLNQRALDHDYTDAFGRTTRLDLRNDIQFQKVTLNFKGWFIDPDFRYLFYTWTSNTSQGDPAQVVVAGNLSYTFNEHLSLAAGIGALPTTRSTNSTFPNWLKNDHRTIADEFFRGSYTTGVWASGTIVPGLRYRAMIGNNLSQLGVNAAQLDDSFNTASAAVWWMPTTGEYGPGAGLGDFEQHERPATLLGAHFTHSREDAQAQPGTEGFENSQLRLSDGTLIFSRDPFGTGGVIRKATYEMLALNSGVKYRGWSLEGEFYYRWLDDFLTVGPIPVSELTDYGFQVQGSTMLLPRRLQAYAAYSKIFGDYGEPWDVSVGVNWFPFERKETHFSVQALYLKDSPVGYSSVPFAVGGNGWVLSTDAIVNF
ncbi:hypothetical protein [Peristeroidobacter soli]|uniref:hypothetical protein n=1 Tax=Peristeroidobacter soli TaxID=2497877 RepID=UPI001C37DDBF|nr:hypothetical protein [Peristeroidobacter soli]